MSNVRMKDTDNHVYNLHDLLGKGATGEVYKGINKTSGEPVALKMFDMRFTKEVEREKKALIKLQHPNIVKFLRCESDYDTLKTVLVMELCEKGSLIDMLREPQNAYGVCEDEFLRIFNHLVAGVKHLRGQGFTHRDIKPGNILVFTDEDGSNVYKLSDFGTAKPLDDKDFFQSLVGTEEYLHPQIFHAAFIDPRQRRTFDASADLWSLGVTFYQIATGSVPFCSYRGRYDRDTMYNEILSKKPPGAIAGHQMVEGGDIQWSKQLPSTCQLSLPLKQYITKLLASMFECGEEWRFEHFFRETEEIIDKRILHMFSSNNGHIYSLFLEKDAKYKIVQEKIATYTGLEEKCQMILFESGDLTGIVSHETNAVDYPLTSRKDPLVLLSRSADLQCSSLFKLTGYDSIIPEISDTFEKDLTLDETFKKARTMSEVIHLNHRLVAGAVLSSEIFIKTLTRHGRKIEDCIYQCKRDLEFLREHFESVKTLTSGDTKVPTQEYARVSQDGDIIDDDFENLSTKLRTCGSKLLDFKDKYDAAKESWNVQESSAIQSQQWEGKAERIVNLCKLRMQKFKENRTKTRLSFHEERLFTFDNMKKRRKKETQVTEQLEYGLPMIGGKSGASEGKALTKLLKKSTQVYDECIQSLKETYLKFVVWHQHYTAFSKEAKEMAEKLEEVRHSIKDLVETMKGMPEPLPPPKKSATQKQKMLLHDVKHEVDGVSKGFLESKDAAKEMRNQLESMDELLKTLPELSDDTG